MATSKKNSTTTTATATAPAPATASGVIKAKCVDNQSIVDQLYGMKLRLMKQTPPSNFYFTVAKALENTKQHVLPIRNYQDFIAIKFVGPSIAQKITFSATTETESPQTRTSARSHHNHDDHHSCDDDGRSATTSTTTTTGTATAVSKKKKSAGNANARNTSTTGTTTNNKRARKLPPQQQKDTENHDDIDDVTTSNATTTNQSTANYLTQLPPPPVTKRSRSAAATANTNTESEQQKGKKQMAYEQAVNASKTWKEQIVQQVQQQQHRITAVEQYQQYQQQQLSSVSSSSSVSSLKWRVVLLIDIREPWCEYIQAKCTMSGIPCEGRQLPIGDMMWIVQGFTTSPSQQQEIVLVEFVMGTILERKTPEDLKSSIFGTRYMEQRLRLQQCGIPQIIFLMEGDIHRELYHCPVSTIQTALWETRLNMNFHVVHTAHADDTVLTLKRYHRRILQRTFPRTFQKNSSNATSATSMEALPTFHEAHRNCSRNNNNSSNTTKNSDVTDRHRRTSTTRPSLSPSSVSARKKRRRLRQRRQSLAELTFDTEPVIPLNMERFISYHELCCKIYYDRECGRQSVYHIHTAMIKQVSTISNAVKCNTIANSYPTIHALCSSYYESIRTNHQNRMQQQQPNSNKTTSNHPADSSSGSNKYPTAQYMVTSLPLLNDTTDGHTNKNKNNNSGDNSNSSTVQKRQHRTIASQKTIGHRSSKELYIAYTGSDLYMNQYIENNTTHFDRNNNDTTTASGRNSRNCQQTTLLTDQPTTPSATEQQPTPQFSNSVNDESEKMLLYPNPPIRKGVNNNATTNNQRQKQPPLPPPPVAGVSPPQNNDSKKRTTCPTNTTCVSLPTVPQLHDCAPELKYNDNINSCRIMKNDDDDDNMIMITSLSNKKRPLTNRANEIVDLFQDDDDDSDDELFTDHLSSKNNTSCNLSRTTYITNGCSSKSFNYKNDETENHHPNRNDVVRSATKQVVCTNGNGGGRKHSLSSSKLTIAASIVDKNDNTDLLSTTHHHRSFQRYDTCTNDNDDDDSVSDLFHENQIYAKTIASKSRQQSLLLGMTNVHCDPHQEIIELLD